MHIFGITARSSTPVLALCRELLAQGLSPDAALAVHRAGTLALRIRSIGEAARLEVNSAGTGFAPLRAVRTASLMRFRDQAATSPPWMQAAE